MRRHRLVIPTTLVVSLGLVAAACGGDNKGGGTAATTAAPATTAAATSTSAAATTTSKAAATTTTAAAAAGGGAAGPVIPAKGSGKYGQDASDPKIYNGAGDFKLDTSKCPSDWNVDQ